MSADANAGYDASIREALEHAGAPPLGGLTERVSTLIGELRQLALILELERLERLPYQSGYTTARRDRIDAIRRELGWLA